jgi:hypothetical protein
MNGRFSVPHPGKGINRSQARACSALYMSDAEPLARQGRQIPYPSDPTDEEGGPSVFVPDADERRHIAVRAQILEITSLNCCLDGTAFVPTVFKPFDALAIGLELSKILERI